ncbi:MAG: hypothetical protein EHM40_18920 [Chloroflexi bacterium]|nr:MAG: hypothetical protein EHM40_18920 [Chloroflexota bacterium]
MVIDFAGEIDLASIKKAVTLMSKSPLWSTALRAAVAILILLTLGGLILSYFSGEPASAARVGRTLVTDLVLGYFVIYPFFASRKLFRRLSEGNQRVTGTVDPIGISYKTAKGAVIVEYPWDTFYHVYKADDVTALATADFKVSILTSSLFANKQAWQQFRQYVDSRVTPAK